MDQFSLRLDHRFDSGDQLFARVSTFDADEVQPFGSSSLQETLVPGFGRTLDTKARNAVVSHTHILEPRSLNELRFGWMHVTGGQVSANRAVDFASQVGLQGVTNDPRDMGYPADLDRVVSTASSAIPPRSPIETISTSSCTRT